MVVYRPVSIEVNKKVSFLCKIYKKFAPKKEKRIDRELDLVSSTANIENENNKPLISPETQNENPTNDSHSSEVSEYIDAMDNDAMVERSKSTSSRCSSSSFSYTSLCNKILGDKNLLDVSEIIGEDKKDKSIEALSKQFNIILNDNPEDSQNDESDKIKKETVIEMEPISKKSITILANCLETEDCKKLFKVLQRLFILVILSFTTSFVATIINKKES